MQISIKEYRRIIIKAVRKAHILSKALKTQDSGLVSPEDEI
jgi:hypothetical protein